MDLPNNKTISVVSFDLVTTKSIERLARYHSVDSDGQSTGLIHPLEEGNVLDG